MAAVAAQTPAEERSAWLADLEHQLRVHAIVGADFNVSFDDWCDGQEEEFLRLLATSRRRLAERGTVTTQEAAAWVVLDDRTIIWRGGVLDCQAVVAFADALTAMRGFPVLQPEGSA